MVLEALKHRYTRALSESDKVEIPNLIEFLALTETQNSIESLLSQISQKHPDGVLSEDQFAILASLDDCVKLIFNIAHLDSEVEATLRRALPVLAIHLLQDPELVFSKKPTLISILDKLSEGLTGWIPKLGAGSEKLKYKLESSLIIITSANFNIGELYSDISAFMSKEGKRTNKQEERLAASETGRVRTQQSKSLSAIMINHATQKQFLTASLLEFLYGAWFESMQLIIINKGLNSEEWQRAEKITETLIKTYQTIDLDSEDAAKEKQYLYKIIEHLPGEIRELLVALAHNTDAAESALQSLESDHVSIISGEELEYIDFEPLEYDQNSKFDSRVSKLLLRKVDALNTGQWFRFTESDDAIRIKLVLKLDDVKQLLFTNRNGMKVLQKSYDEFAYYLSSHTIKGINQGDVFSSTFTHYFRGIIEEYEKHKRLIADRRIEVEEQDIARKAARTKALAEAKQLAIEKKKAKAAKLASDNEARLNAAKLEASKAENATLVEKFQTSVRNLNTGARLTLPCADSKQSECKLAVKISSTDKMIFVNTKGMRAGEYNSTQLVQLLVVGEATIIDDGVEFEDTLAQVVSKLRHDRNKSYDDLTGE
ncbi:MAG: DUF1631 family protein [Pseudomonadales bacterium]|nr:DUF1631 family protein [Pseudomonadales bacterium]